MTDLIRRAQAGDEEAFHALYREHVGRVYALCLRLTADKNEALERVQDVFVRAWRKLGSFRGDSAFATWLYRLAANVVLQAGADAGRRRRRFETVDAPGALEPLGNAPALADKLDLERAIARLPDGARVVFVLYDVEGYTHAEIAGLCGIAEGTSKAHLFRARRLLRELLER